MCASKGDRGGGERENMPLDSITTKPNTGVSKAIWGVHDNILSKSPCVGIDLPTIWQAVDITPQ